jgi:hypothetical protein
MLIFTGSAATARDLHGGDLKCGLVTSRERTRDAVLHAFRAGRIDVVVSTDMAAEGLNLQRAGTRRALRHPLEPGEARPAQRPRAPHRPACASMRARDLLRSRSRAKPVSSKRSRERTAMRQARARPAARHHSDPSSTLPDATHEATAAFVASCARPRMLALPDMLARRHKAGIEAVDGGDEPASISISAASMICSRSQKAKFESWSAVAAATAFVCQRAARTYKSGSGGCRTPG